MASGEQVTGRKPLALSLQLLARKQSAAQSLSPAQTAPITSSSLLPNLTTGEKIALSRECRDLGIKAGDRRVRRLIPSRSGQTCPSHRPIAARNLPPNLLEWKKTLDALGSLNRTALLSETRWPP